MNNIWDLKGYTLILILCFAFSSVMGESDTAKTSLLNVQEEGIKNNTTSVTKTNDSGTSSKCRWGVGVDIGIHTVGIQSRVLFRDVLGAKLTLFSDYTPKGGGGKLQLVYRMPLKKSMTPYFVAGGGGYLRKVDTTYKEFPLSKWVSMATFSVGGGCEFRFGEKRNHGLSLEVAYQKGEGYYTHTVSSLGNLEPVLDTVDVEAPPLFASLQYTLYPQKRDKTRDKDGDGLFDKVDRCPEEAEDQDGFMDSDGCPDLDNDDDGVLDSVDKCLNDAEDKDGIMDEDGCPDHDDDFDGINNESDRCPTEKEDKDGFEDSDGCPDPDNDGDKLLDSYDKCPDVPEDLDGFEDVDGCPDPDNDGDGFADAHDSCPNEAEVVNSYLDNDGCPDTVLTISRTATVLKGIQFRGGGAQLHESSFPILDEVVKSMGIWEEMKIEVSAHTDARANAKSGRILTRKRAQSIRKYLLSQGVTPDRVTAKGYGKDRPIAHNSSAAGRAKNRRVEVKRVD